MIPDADTLLGVARSLGDPCNEKSVRASIQHARTLAKWVTDEPAAIFYALACRPRGFAPRHRAMTIWLARDIASRNGSGLQASDEDLLALYRSMGDAQRPGFEPVRQWFAERMPAN